MGASKAVLWGQLTKLIKILDELFKASATTSSTNFLTLLDSLQKDYEGNHINQTDSKLNSIRSSLSSFFSGYSVLQALVVELAKNGYSSQATSVQAALDDIAKGMAGSETVKNRAWTYGAMTAGETNVGTGILYRSTYDKYGNVIESGSPVGGVIKAEVVSDKNLGRDSGTETATIMGSGMLPVDNLDLGTIPAGAQTLTATRAIDGLLSNPDFVSFTGTGLSDIAWDSWTVADATKADDNNSIYFRAQTDGTAGVSVEFTDNNSLTQYFSDISSTIDSTKPCFLIVRYRRKTSCDGSLTIRLGSKTAAVADLTTKTDATWFDLVLGVDSSDGFYDNFKEDSGGNGCRVAITLASRTTGSLLIGEVILVQPTLFDGKWYLLTAGQTDFLKSDYWTFTDTVANTGRVQYWLSRLAGKYLPHTSGTPTYADA